MKKKVGYGLGYGLGSAGGNVLGAADSWCSVERGAWSVEPAGTMFFSPLAWQ